MIMLNEWEENGVGHFPHKDGHTAIGMNMTLKNGEPYFRYISDGTDVPKVLIDKLTWETGFPEASIGDSCVAVANRKFKNVRCDSIFDGKKSDKIYNICN